MDGDLSRYVGRLEGRTVALEGRADRFENAVTAQLASMDGKLDSQDAKIDAITAALAELSGKNTGRSDIIRWAVTIVTVIISVTGALFRPHG